MPASTLCPRRASARPATALCRARSSCSSFSGAYPLALSVARSCNRLFDPRAVPRQRPSWHRELLTCNDSPFPPELSTKVSSRTSSWTTPHARERAHPQHTHSLSLSLSRRSGHTDDARPLASRHSLATAILVRLAAKLIAPSSFIANSRVLWRYCAHMAAARTTPLFFFAFSISVGLPLGSARNKRQSRAHHHVTAPLSPIEGHWCFDARRVPTSNLNDVIKSGFILVPAPPQSYGFEGGVRHYPTIIFITMSFLFFCFVFFFSSHRLQK